MTAELTYLVYSAGLAFALILTAATLAIREYGGKMLAGTRDSLPPPKNIFLNRARRTVNNMLENLLLFAIIVLAAQAAGVSNAYTVLGAQIFFFARVAFAMLYIAGVPWLRTLAWLAGVCGTLLIAAQLF